MVKVTVTDLAELHQIFAEIGIPEFEITDSRISTAVSEYEIAFGISAEFKEAKDIFNRLLNSTIKIDKLTYQFIDKALIGWIRIKLE